jgi:hypothetical protein
MPSKKSAPAADRDEHVPASEIGKGSSLPRLPMKDKVRFVSKATMLVLPASVDTVNVTLEAKQLISMRGGLDHRDSHVTSEELSAGQDNDDKSDGEDKTLNDTEEAGVTRVQPGAPTSNDKVQEAAEGEVHAAEESLEEYVVVRLHGLLLCELTEELGALGRRVRVDMAVLNHGTLLGTTMADHGGKRGNIEVILVWKLEQSTSTCRT